MTPRSKTLPSVQTLMAVICALGVFVLIADLAIDRQNPLVASRGFDYGVLMVVIGGLGFVYLWLWQTNVRLLIGSDQVGYQDIFRRRRYWLKGQIKRAVDMMVVYTKSAHPLRGVYFLTDDGKRVLALNTRAWAADDVQAFVQASGAAFDYREQSLTVAEARHQFPKAFGWGSQHVMLGTMVTIVVAVALAIGGYVLLMTLLHG